MKISTKAFKKPVVLIIAVLVLCAVALAVYFCLPKNGSGENSDQANSSSTVSIYYKDDTSSEVIYDDIISDTGSSNDGDLAGDATPELIVPSDKTSSTSSKDSTTSSDAAVSKPSQSSSNISSNSSSQNTSNDSSSSQSSSTSSQDKNYTKPY